MLPSPFFQKKPNTLIYKHWAHSSQTVLINNKHIETRRSSELAGFFYFSGDANVESPVKSVSPLGKGIPWQMVASSLGRTGLGTHDSQSALVETSPRRRTTSVSVKSDDFRDVAVRVSLLDSCRQPRSADSFRRLDIEPESVASFNLPFEVLGW